MSPLRQGSDVLTLVRILSIVNIELRMAVMDTLCSLIVQLGPDFAIFVPTIAKVSYKSFDEWVKGSEKF